MPVHVVEVIVAPVDVAGGRDGAVPVDDRFLESAVLRPVRVVVAQVPLAEDARPIAVVGEDVCHRRCAAGEEVHAVVGALDGDGAAVPARQQRRASRRALWRDVEIRQPDTFAVELVEIRRLDPPVAVACQVAVALIIGHDEDDIGPCLARDVLRDGRAARSRKRRQRGVSQEVTSVRIHGSSCTPTFPCRAPSVSLRGAFGVPDSPSARDRRRTWRTIVPAVLPGRSPS